MQSPDELTSALNDLLDPWLRSLENPKASQEETLRGLLEGFAKTEFGETCGAKNISSIEEFRSSFPVVDYNTLLPELGKVKAGNQASLLPEPVARWVMTRGTTGKPKVIPTTETFLSQIFACGARAIVNFALRKDSSVLESKVLNLNFPSEVFSMPGEETKYGYSSGTYAKLFPSLDNTGLSPPQEEIDALGGGIGRSDWERRFELVLNKTKAANIGTVMGVTPVILSFARYVKRKFGFYPKEIWKMKALFLTSVAKIHSKYPPIMRHYYGDSVPVSAD